MANAKISDDSVFVPKTDILDVVGLAGFDNNGNVKISGLQLKTTVLSGAIQTITATSPLVRTTGNDTTLSISQANTNTDGFLSFTDWNTFNNKSETNGTVTEVNGTGSISGITLDGKVTSSGNITLGGSLSLTSSDVTNGLGFAPYPSSNPNLFTSNTGTITSIVFNSPLTGGTINSSGTVSIPAATTGNSGYLTQSDWNTFNNKTNFAKPAMFAAGPSLASGVSANAVRALIGAGTGDGDVTASSSTNFTNKTGNISQWTNNSSFTSNTGTVTEVSTVAPLSGLITGQGSLSISKSDQNTNGYLSSGDWSSFNGKTSFAEPGIFSGGGTPTLASNVTGQEIRSLIGAGIGDVTSDSATDFTNKTGDISQWTNDMSFTANLGTVTPDGAADFTNKTGSNLQWTNDAGYITTESDSQNLSFSSPNLSISNGNSVDLSALTNDNDYVDGASYATGTLTLNRTGSLANITATGFLQVGSLITDALAGNTTTITTQQAGEITANTAKTGITVQQAGEITDNTAKVGITNAQAGEITANTAKTGITTAQATEISDNTLKVSMVIGNASNEAMAGDTSIPSNNNQLTNGQNFITAASVPDVNDGTLTISLNGTDTTFSANQSGNSSVSITTGNSDNFYVTGASYTAGTLTLTRNGSLADLTATGFLQVGATSSDALAGDTVTITGTQAGEISANTSKISDTGIPAIITVSDGTLSFANSNVTGATIRTKIGAGTGNGDVTAVSSTTFTNKSGSNSQWTNDEGYITSAAIPTNNNQLTNGAGYTTNTGTTTASNSQTFTNKSGSNSQWTNDEGYTTAAGTVTSSGGANKRLAVFSSATNIGGSDDVMWDGVNFEISALDPKTALVIDAIDDDAPAPRIVFKQSSSESANIIVDKTANFNFLTKNNAGNLEPRLTIVGDKGNLKFNNYTATATATSATAIDPNQNFYPSGTASDTTTDLAVDEEGNVVRTTQEATWNLTRAQVDALTTSTTGTTLISAPGTSSLFIIIEKVTFLILFAFNNNKMSATQQYQILQDGNVADEIAVINGQRINDIAFAGGNANTSGIYEHDTGYSTLNRTYKPNTATTIRRVNTSPLNTAITTMSIKIRYRVYDTVTF